MRRGVVCRSKPASPWRRRARCCNWSRCARRPARAFVQQHLHDLLRRVVAEQLAEFLLVPGDAVALDHGDEIPWRVAGQRALAEMRIRRQEVGRRRAGVGEVAAAAARHQDLLADSGWHVRPRSTRRPRWPAVSAHISPAAPPPMTTHRQSRCVASRLRQRTFRPGPAACRNWRRCTGGAGPPGNSPGPRRYPACCSACRPPPRAPSP